MALPVEKLCSNGKKAILKHYDVNTRLHLANQYQDLESAEKGTLMNIEKLEIRPHEYTIDNTVYKLTVIKQRKNARLRVRRPNEWGVAYDMDPYGFRDYSKTGDLQEGDILIRKGVEPREPTVDDVEKELREKEKLLEGMVKDRERMEKELAEFLTQEKNLGQGKLGQGYEKLGQDDEDEDDEFQVEDHKCVMEEVSKLLENIMRDGEREVFENRRQREQGHRPDIVDAGLENLDGNFELAERIQDEVVRNLGQDHANRGHGLEIQVGDLGHGPQNLDNAPNNQRRHQDHQVQNIGHDPGNLGHQVENLGHNPGNFGHAHNNRRNFGHQGFLGHQSQDEDDEDLNQWFEDPNAPPPQILLIRNVLPGHRGDPNEFGPHLGQIEDLGFADRPEDIGHGHEDLDHIGPEDPRHPLFVAPRQPRRLEQTKETLTQLKARIRNTEMDLKNLRDTFVPYQLKRDGAESQYDLFIQFTKIDPDQNHYVERFAYTKSLGEAERFLTNKIFGDRAPAIQVNRLEITGDKDEALILRLPPKLKLQYKTLHGVGNISDLIEKLKPITEDPSEPLERLESPDFHVDYCSNPVVQRAKCLVISAHPVMYPPIFAMLRKSNKKILVKDENGIIAPYITTLIELWIKENEDIGTVYKFEFDTQGKCLEIFIFVQQSFPIGVANGNRSFLIPTRADALAQISFDEVEFNGPDGHGLPWVLTMEMVSDESLEQ